ncbi:PTS sugar transporter subunit IIB [Clostridium sp.]|uniref:PTS sugar transporter subunit IIB n=1 Tax=Clostridium sp. TaxID=1506 RepID=UPI0025C3C5A1|nr:PTS sugar transporter subunit IIB [Clostridium sp.]
MKILILCATGTSSNIVVEAVKKAVGNRDIKIFANGIEELRESGNECDLILLGPQIKYKLEAVQKIVGNKNIPVGIIDSMDYGLCRGKEILDKAIQIISLFKGE